MSNRMKPIPIGAVKRMADEFGYDQVVVVARAVGDGGGEHVTTYGRDAAHCSVAARMGDFFKHKLMGWPAPEAAGPNASTERIPTAQEMKDWMRTPEGRKALGIPESDPQVTITTTHDERGRPIIDHDAAGHPITMFYGPATAASHETMRAAPQEAAEPTREDALRTAFIEWAKDEWGENTLAFVRFKEGREFHNSTITDAWKQWQSMARALRATPRTEAAAVAPDAPIFERQNRNGKWEEMNPDEVVDRLGNARVRYTHPTAPSNVREQALEEGFRKGVDDAARLVGVMVEPDNGEFAYEYTRVEIAQAIRALKSADAGKVRFLEPDEFDENGKPIARKPS